MAFGPFDSEPVECRIPLYKPVSEKVLESMVIHECIQSLSGLLPESRQRVLDWLMKHYEQSE